MSSTPMKRPWSAPGLVQELIWCTIQVKVREYKALDMACLFSRAYKYKRNVLEELAQAPWVFLSFRLHSSDLLIIVLPFRSTEGPQGGGPVPPSILIFQYFY